MWPFSSTYSGLLSTIDQVATPYLADSSSYTSQEEAVKGRPEYDYIIVGGGTAGCVLARRLSENPNVSVLVLERGDASTSWVSTVPMFSLVKTFDNSKYPYVDKWFGTWEEGSVYDKSIDYSKLLPLARNLPSYSNFSTVPDPEGRTSRRVSLVTGRSLGGSTKVNAQIYTRPFAGELDAWAASCGDPTWNYESMKELMKRSENNIGASAAEQEFRGQDGPWVTRKYDKVYFKGCKSFVKACETIGIPLVAQSNHPNGPAVKSTEIDRTMGEHGRRITTFQAFLPPDVLRERKSRLTVCTGVVVSSVDVCSDEGGLSAKGVFLEPASGMKGSAKKYYVAARREVILCSGATASPQLLMLSGIGPKKHLEHMGISVIKDLPGVGAHLQDHPTVPLIYSIPIQDSLLVIQKKPVKALTEILKYLIFKTGLVLFPIPQFLLFMRSALLHDPTKEKPDETGSIEFQVDADPSQLDARIPENVPDIELQSIPLSASYRPVPLPKGRGCQSILCLILQQYSLGSITLSSRDPHERPKCTLGLVSHPNDLIVMRKAVRLGMKIGKAMKEQGYDIEPILIPRSEKEEDLDEFIWFEPRCNFHLSSTCRMAPELPQNPSSNEDNINAAGVGKTPGVVDSQLRVYGVKGLRIADASVFPTIPAGHLQASVVLVGEKCAEIIKGTWI